MKWNWRKLILFFVLFITSNVAWPDAYYPGLQVDVERNGRLYAFSARFDTPLTQCAAYRYLTDYESAKELPGIVEVLARRLSANKVEVKLMAEEPVLFFSIQIISVMEYTEKPFDSLAYMQVAGKSKQFQGKWDIESSQQGSTIRFHGLWEPSIRIPLFLIDPFVKGSLTKKFDAIARLAEKRKGALPAHCAD